MRVQWEGVMVGVRGKRWEFWELRQHQRTTYGTSNVGTHDRLGTVDVL
jgi:hypothetical protein